MNSMWLLSSVVPATLPLVLGYFVLFSAARTQGATAKFGRILAAWLFVLAGLFPLAGAYISFAGFSPLDAAMQRMESMHPGR